MFKIISNVKRGIHTPLFLIKNKSLCFHQKGLTLLEILLMLIILSGVFTSLYGYMSFIRLDSREMNDQVVLVEKALSALEYQKQALATHNTGSFFSGTNQKETIFEYGWTDENSYFGEINAYLIFEGESYYFIRLVSKIGDIEGNAPYTEVSQFVTITK